MKQGIKDKLPMKKDSKHGKKKTNYKKNPIKEKKFPNGTNDLAWYNNYPELASGLIGANFSRRKGIAEQVSNTTDFTIPSVASLETILTIGHSSGDAFNSAVDKMWASLRSANTGSVVYTKTDLQYYLLNLRQILAETRVLRRAYGVIKKFDLFDKTTPISIFKAMGLDYDTFAANAANLRNELNYVSTRIHTLMPGKLDILERTCWMFDNIFTDSNDAKAQLYLFALANDSCYMYSWTGLQLINISPSAAITNFANTSTQTGLNYANAMANFKTHVDHALASDKVQMIAADILKAYGTNQIAYFEEIPENYEVHYVYSEEVLTQIQNANIIGGSRSSTAIQDSSHNISLSGNYLVAEAHLASGSTVIDDSDVNVLTSYINMYKDNISNLDLLGATRLMWTASRDANVAGRLNLDTFGTEIIRSFDVVTAMKPYGDTGTYLYDLYLREYATLNLGAPSTVIGICEMCLTYALWSTFDWAPRIYISKVDAHKSDGSSLSVGICSYPIWDFNNYAKVEFNQLSTYNDIAIMSLYYVPSLVKNVNLFTIK